MDENVKMEELNVEETSQMNEFYSEQEEASSSMPWKILGAGAAAMGIVGGLCWKKFGPSIKGKISERKKTRLEAKKTRLAEQQMKLDVELKKYETEDKPAEKTEE